MCSTLDACLHACLRTFGRQLGSQELLPAVVRRLWLAACRLLAQVLLLQVLAHFLQVNGLCVLERVLDKAQDRVLHLLVELELLRNSVKIFRIQLVINDVVIHVTLIISVAAWSSLKCKIPCWKERAGIII